MGTTMNIQITQPDTQSIIVKLNGEFDACGCKEVREKLEGVAGDCKDKTLLMDLCEVSFIDSSGIGAIVFLFKRLRAVNGQLEIINVRNQPQELITLLRVHEAIPVQWYEADSSPTPLSAR